MGFLPSLWNPSSNTTSTIATSSSITPNLLAKIRTHFLDVVQIQTQRVRLKANFVQVGKTTFPCGLELQG